MVDACFSEKMIWSFAFDPSDEKDYRMNWGQFMQDSADSINTADVILPQGAVDDGLVVFNITNTTDSVTMWFSMEPQFRDNPKFSGSGVSYDITVRVVTTSVRTYEKSAALTVKQL